LRGNKWSPSTPFCPPTGLRKAIKILGTHFVVIPSVDSHGADLAEVSDQRVGHAASEMLLVLFAGEVIERQHRRRTDLQLFSVTTQTVAKCHARRTTDCDRNGVVRPQLLAQLFPRHHLPGGFPRRTARPLFRVSASGVALASCRCVSNSVGHLLEDSTSHLK